MKTKETSIFNCENGNNENSTFHLYEKLLKKNEIIPFSKLHYNTNIKKKNLLIHFILDKEIKSKNNILNEIDEKIKDYDEIYQVNILDYNYPPINNDNLNFKYHFLPRISEIFLKKLKEK